MDMNDPYIIISFIFAFSILITILLTLVYSEVRVFIFNNYRERLHKMNEAEFNKVFKRKMENGTINGIDDVMNTYSVLIPSKYTSNLYLSRLLKQFLNYINIEYTNSDKAILIRWTEQINAYINKLEHHQFSGIDSEERKILIEIQDLLESEEIGPAKTKLNELYKIIKIHKDRSKYDRFIRIFSFVFSLCSFIALIYNLIKYIINIPG